MSDNDSSSGFLAGLVLGAMAGAAAALLLSPRSGRENREFLGEKLPELRERAPDIVSRASTEVRTRIQEGREAFHQGAEETREHLSQELDEKRRGDEAKGQSA